MNKNYTYVTDKEKIKKLKYEYEYIVLVDKNRTVLVINSRSEKDCLFDGKEVERGIILKPDDGDYLGAIFNKKHEYEKMLS